MKKKVVKLSLWRIFILLASVQYNVVYAASFDCSKASSPVEKMICSSEELSLLDEDMAVVFRILRENSNNSETIRSDQLRWLKNGRGTCQDLNCIRSEYMRHIDELISNSSNSNAVSNYSSNNTETHVYDGRSVAGIVLGSATAIDVLQHLGVPNSIEQFGDYSKVLRYRSLGIDVYYRVNDSAKRIFSLQVKHPYKIQVSGIVLNSSTMRDVRSKFSKLDWYTTAYSDFWFSQHGYISFGVLRDKSQVPLDEPLHLDKKISIIKFECGKVPDFPC